MNRRTAEAWNAYASAANAGAPAVLCSVLRGRYIYLATGLAGGRYRVGQP